MGGENLEGIGQGCLFGWQHSPRKGERGRPPHVWSVESSNKVKLLLALGWNQGRIANALNITEPTLRKHYLSELKVRALARDSLDARRAELLWAQCERGNVGALKAFHALMIENDRMHAARRLRDDDAPDAIKAPVPKAEPQGKKQRIRAQAQDLISNDPDLMPGLALTPRPN